MQTKKAISTEAARLLAMFREAGAQVIETDILQPADILFGPVRRRYSRPRFCDR